MNCFDHPTQVAVAQCANVCGRSLCSDCARATNPPVCSVCAAALVEAQKAEAIDERSFYQKRIRNNLIYYVVLLGAFINVKYIASPNDSAGAVLFLIAVLLGYGLLMGRNGGSAVWQVPGATTVVSNTEAMYLSLLQAAFIGVFSFIFVPIIVILDISRMSKLPKEA